MTMTVPLTCIPVALAIVYFTKVPAMFVMAKLPGGYDNKNPRDQQARLDGAGKRAMAAHANGFESFPGFAAGVLVSHVTGANLKWATLFAVTHVVMRLLYVFFYVGNIDKLRSTVWSIGIACTGALMFLPFFS